jgi:hypothetical protein
MDLIIDTTPLSMAGKQDITVPPKKFIVSILSAMHSIPIISFRDRLLS